MSQLVLSRKKFIEKFSPSFISSSYSYLQLPLSPSPTEKGENIKRDENELIESKFLLKAVNFSYFQILSSSKQVCPALLLHRYLTNMIAITVLIKLLMIVDPVQFVARLVITLSSEGAIKKKYCII